LTSLAIGVGAFTLTLALAAGEGAREYADKIVTSNVNPQALIVGKDKSLFGGQAGQQTAPREYDPNATTLGGSRGGGGITLSRLTEQDISAIAKISGVQKVEPMYDVTIRYIYAPEHPAKKYTAAVTTYNPSILVETTAGKVPALNTDIKADEVTIPDAYAKSLGFKDARDAIGKKVVLHLERAANVNPEEIQQIIITQGIAGLQNLKTTDSTEVTLTVIATTNVSSLSFQGSDSIAVPAAKAKEMAEFLTSGTNDYQKYLLASVSAKDGVKPEDVKAALVSKGYNARTAKDIQSLLFQVVNILQGVVAGFGILALIASVFGIINTQYISVLERTQQIGLMKALDRISRRRDWFDYGGNRRYRAQSLDYQDSDTGRRCKSAYLPAIADRRTDHRTHDRGCRSGHSASTQGGQTRPDRSTAYRIIDAIKSVCYILFFKIYRCQKLSNKISLSHWRRDLPA
jgi:putative ABC transport system permease protein